MHTTSVTGHKLRGALVDTPDSVGGRRRERRWARLLAAFPQLRDMNVLDLGGDVDTWERASERAAHVHIVNCAPAAREIPDWADHDCCDACDLPARLRGRRYDLVYCNSVIEHVGGYARRLALADTIRQAAERHWVQTPYRYFPLEPHLLFPGYQLLPLAARASVAQHWPLIHTRPADRRAAIRKALSLELLGRTEFAFLFPDSEILVERMAGLPKSLVAVRSA